MNPRIVGIAGPLNGMTLALTDEEISVGREASNKLWAADSAMSRRHFTIVKQEDGRFLLRDLGGRNGTRVNGEKIDKHELCHRDQITVGNSTLVFLLGDEEAIAERNPLELDDTTVEEDVVASLHPEDSSYLHPERTSAQPKAERLAADLSTVLKIATHIGGIRDEGGLQWQLLGMLFDVVPAQRAAILFLDGAGEIASSAAWDRVHGPEVPVRVSRTLLKKITAERTGLLLDNIKRSSVGQAASLQSAGVKSALCVPLLLADRVSGVIYLDTRRPENPFDSDHLQLITAVAGLISLAWDRVRHLQKLQEENKYLHEEINLNHEFVGDSSRMRAVYELIRRVAATDSTVLIQGESGTGKELVAHAVHNSSSRADGPFVAVNCAAITETLLESELFGHEKGAFTGAVAQKKGKVELANGGTLFLDEIGEFAVALQAKLLRVLQEREFERVGGTHPMKIDVRFVAATNRGLLQAVEAGTFRRDLYHRLNVVSITLPALRERAEDIALLADYFVAKASRKCRMRPKPISPEAQACLLGYDWPGNVRELEHAMERALVLGSSDNILPEDLPAEIFESASGEPSSSNYQSVVKEQKKQVVQKAMQQSNGNYIEAAKLLGIHPNSLLRLVRNLNLKGSFAEPQPRGSAPK
ncbi:MAG TPA: sigma 54-interacting transcriptional regulator [Candidatus Aquilonibacter sp.]|jgi:transcriptional regulator with GAF, ATPase, and Fis domain|nr:sigma 54-interacting transcriptional regulator [Candidatus Aquilonibacter sp.]